MKKDKENKLLDKYKMYIAISNFQDSNENKRTNEYPLNCILNKWREFTMKKRIVLTSILSICLISGVALATNMDNIRNYFRGLGEGIESAIENGYIQDPEMDYIDKNVNVSKEPDKIIDNMNLKVKIDDFLMDDYNLSVEFNFEFDEEINKYVSLDNIHNIELKDLIVRDEENRIIYSGSDKESFEEYCKFHNLDYKFGEFNDKYLNNGLNWFPSYHNKENRIVKLMYNMYTEQYPKSKKLYFSFGKIDINEENSEIMTELNGNWEIELDVPERMYNRTTVGYKVVSCSNDDFKVYSSTVSDTGFEIGVIINNIEKVQYPEEIKKIQREIWSKYEGVVDQTEANNEFQKILKENENLAKLNNEYFEKRNPISLVEYNNTNQQNVSFVENENGNKFICTMSPSRKAKCDWIDGNKYDFYETFGMIKYDSTNKIKVVLYYYGEPVTIELEKME